MSSSRSTIYQSRHWMYSPINPEMGGLTQEFISGVENFMDFAKVQPKYIETGMLRCPCLVCNNGKSLKADIVSRHIFHRGFAPNYYVWFAHGEDFIDPSMSFSSSHHVVGGHQDEPSYSTGGYNPEITDQSNRYVEMVTDAFRESVGVGNLTEEPNLETRRFYEMLDAANHPIYDGCRVGHSPLSLSARMMGIKTNYNMAEGNVDACMQLMKEYLPEDNLAPETYYEVKKMVQGLGLPFEKIDVCIDNCMIFWRGEDAKLKECRFCHKPRFKPTRGRTKVPYKRMWYMPITDRLKRLYQSDHTAASMRWHAEHFFDGEISHPSDAKAWKHFQSIYPDFASEPRNVYLGLCTDGFKSSGKTGRNYSLWPVILTPYNLPPNLCMKREFLFLSTLIPGPEQPSKSLDIFLQPLVHELQELWYNGACTFDVSQQCNFSMRAVLMWTISDFPAYAMLLGWSTKGKLACPYCNKSTEAFQLNYGQKPCWFDCHRRFLPTRHPYRKSKITNHSLNFM